MKNKKIKAKTINIDKAGELSILLSDWEKKNIEELTIIGEMNGSDFKIILDIATKNKLSFIDLSETNIVSGGDYYFSDSSTKNNVLGDYQFCFCEKLEKIILPKTIVKIGEWAFNFCSNLTSLVIYSKVKSIKPEIWVGCDKLNDVKIIDNSNFHFENNILYDKNYTKIIAALQTGFYGELTIKEGIKEIQSHAFYDCKSLTSVIFPSTLTKIGEDSFRYSGLTSIIFNKALETIDIYAFSNCDQLKEINLVEVKIKKLKKGIFSDCGLETIYLPKQLIAMKELVFENNPLKHIFCFSNNPSDLYDFPKYNATFKDVDFEECILHVPKGKINIYKETKGWNSFNSIIDDSQDFLNTIESKENKSYKKSDSSKKSNVEINKLLNLTKYLNL